MDKSDLAELVACTRCDLAATRQRVVVGSGPSRAKVLIVGEAPGRQEDEGGEPFIGRSGQLLFRLLAEIGLVRDDCFVTNVVKCRPPANRAPRAHEMAACAPWLALQISEVGSVPLLALGAIAARSVFGVTRGIGVIHGRVLDADRHRGLVTYHPAAALRGGQRVVSIMRDDFATLREMMS